MEEKMSNTPDLDRAREALTEIVMNSNLDTALMRQHLIDKLVNRELEQRAEEAERCREILCRARIIGPLTLKERAISLRSQIGGKS